jgi:hypothetical protein
MGIRYTKHAGEVIAERGLTPAQVEKVVRNPGWQDRRGDEVHFSKRVGKKVLRVVAVEDALGL